MVILFQPSNLRQIPARRRPFGAGVLPKPSAEDRTWAAQHLNASARDFDVVRASERPLDAITDDNLIDPSDETEAHDAGRECERGRA
jgi:hypothetical protein